MPRSSGSTPREAAAAVTGIKPAKARFDPQRAAAENRAAVTPVLTSGTPTEVWRWQHARRRVDPPDPARQSAPAARRARPGAVAQSADAPVAGVAAAARVDAPAGGPDRPPRGARTGPTAKPHDGSEPFGFPLPWLASAGESAANSMMPLSPQRLLDLQQDYLQRVGSMWTTFFEHPDKASEPIKDSRFSDPAWQKNSLASLYARAYLLNAEFLNKMADAVEMDRKTKKRVKFAVQQWVEASAPSNFLATNPKAQQTLLETGGESLKARPRQPARRPAARQDHADRRDARSRSAATWRSRRARRLRERADPADPVQAADAARSHSRPLPDRAALHQQVLHPRPAAGELVRPLRGRSRATRCSWCRGATRSARGEGSRWDDYLEEGVIARASHVVAGDRRREADQRRSASASAARCSRTRSPCCRARRASRSRASTLLDHACSTSRTPAQIDVFVDEAAGARGASSSSAKGGLMPGRELAITFNSLRAERPDLELRRQQLPRGQAAAGVRPAVLERRQHQPAGPDVHAGTCATCTSRTTCACRASSRAAASRSTWTGSRCRPTCSRRARTTSCRGSAAYASARLMLGGGKAGGVRYVLGASGHIAGSDQPGVEEQAQLLDRRSTTSFRRTRRRGCTTPTEHPGQLVARLEQVAVEVRRTDEAGAEAVRQREVQGDRARARSLRQREGLRREQMSNDMSSSPPRAPRSASSAARWRRFPRRNSAPSSSRKLLARAGVKPEQVVRSDPRPGAHRRRRPEPGAPGGDQGRAARTRCPAMTINKVCGSGLKAVMLAAQAIANGDAEIVVAGGQENMSASPHVLQGSRDGFRMGDAKLIDTHDRRRPVGRVQPVPHGHHRRERREGVRHRSRAEQDEFAVASQQKAEAAQKAGPVQGRDRPGA